MENNTGLGSNPPVKDGMSQVRDYTGWASEGKEGVLQPHKLLPHLNNATAFPLDEPEPSAASQPYGEQVYFNIKFLQVLSGAFMSCCQDQQLHPGL